MLRDNVRPEISTSMFNATVKKKIKGDQSVAWFLSYAQQEKTQCFYTAIVTITASVVYGVMSG